MLLFSNMPLKKATTLIEYIKGPSLIHEESEDLEFTLSQLKKKVNEMNGHILKNVNFSGSQ